MQAISITLFKNFVFPIGMAMHSYSDHATVLGKFNEGQFLELLMLEQSSHYIQQQWRTVLWER